jgi:hypothetical protein
VGKFFYDPKLAEGEEKEACAGDVATLVAA